MIRLLLALAVPLVGAATVPAALAQTAMTPDQAAAVQRALDRGQLIYAYDQAAWHGTDDMLSRVPDAKSRVGGWIVDGPEGSPEIVFFDRDRDDPHAIYVATYRDGAIVDPRVLGEGDDRTLSPARKTMIAARAVARDAIVASGDRPCATQPFNTVVLPPETRDGPTLVYLLTPQTSNDSVPAGGHFLIEVSPEGRAGPVRAFTKSCIELETRGSKDKTVGLVVGHLLDPTPTEIHVFTMLAAQLPIYVSTTQNGMLWVVDAPNGQARISLVDRKGKDDASH